MATPDRTYTINLRKDLTECPRYRRTKKAMSLIKLFVIRHMKVEEVKVGDELNRHLWSQGIKNPPRRFTVSIHKEGTTAYVNLEGHDPKLMKGLTKEAKEKVKKETEKKEKQLAKDEKAVKDALGKKEEAPAVSEKSTE
jgi:large subunit ribosomal protein L31e